MRDLPEAVPQDPLCGACGSETYCDGEEYRCDECQLTFDSMTMEAAFIDDRVEACGSPCDNTWHQRDHAIRPGLGFDCHPCRLPAGHTSFHWTGCTKRAVPVPES